VIFTASSHRNLTFLSCLNSCLRVRFEVHYLGRCEGVSKILSFLEWDLLGELFHDLIFEATIFDHRNTNEVSR
jgi:hypothetical protein